MDENKMSINDRFNSDKSDAYDEKIMKAMPGYQISHELTRFLLEDILPDTSKILVSGCGTGKELIDYSINNSQWQFLGFDPSEKMLSMAREKVKVNNCAERVRLLKGMTAILGE